MLLNFFKDSAAVIESLDDLIDMCKQVAEEIKKVHDKGNSILLAGNGGSCSDSLHFAGSYLVLIREVIENLFGQFVYNQISLP